MAALPMASPVLGAPVRVSSKTKRPFWLLVPPGTPETLIWSKSFWPLRSNKAPNLKVWLPTILVTLLETT